MQTVTFPGLQVSAQKNLKCCPRFKKTNNFLIDDLLGPNDKPRTRGAQRERRW